MLFENYVFGAKINGCKSLINFCTEFHIKQLYVAALAEWKSDQTLLSAAGSMLTSTI